MSIKIFLFLFIILIVEVFAQSTFTLKPSVYYTRGNYTNEDHSNSFASYVSGTWNNIDHIILACDNLNITSKDWKYHQKNIIAGIVYNISSYYLKLNYFKINGDYTEGVTNYSYTDNSSAVNLDIVKGDYPYYYGIGYTYFTQQGQPNVNSHQANLRFEFIPHYKIFMGLRTTASFSNDNRSLFSVAAKFNYQPSSDLLIKSNLMYGKRTLFVDPDLLILFNQIYTQKILVGIQLEYNLFSKLTIVSAFQHTQFESYKIDYLIGGLKLNIDL
ncbi:MAG: hypothetical protein FJ213_03645 [Ignavibacteria bacterium]|nr:hypothetical protein [Ignavibacteria bacterium]